KKVTDKKKAPKAVLPNSLPPHVKLSPALQHFSALLSSLEESEQAPVALRLHANSEINLVQRYFSHAESEVKVLREGARTPSPERDGFVRRRREKWGEMQRMREY